MWRVIGILTLLLVMVGALVVTVPIFPVILRRQSHCWLRNLVYQLRLG